MDSFANNDRDYSDGQKNKIPVPEEIQVYGFKPPVKLPDGSVQEGDFLAANHLNFILNDLYSQLKDSLIVTQKSGNNTAGFRKFSNGDIEMWGNATTSTGGLVTVAYPTALPALTRDIQITYRSAGMNGMNVKIIGEPTSTGFTVGSADAAGAAAVGHNFYWKAVYHG